MSVDLSVEARALVAGVAAEILTEKRAAILGFIDRENPVAADALTAAIKKAEPGGFKFALVADSLNHILDGLEDEEKAALPKGAEELLDWVISSLTALAKPE